jgi:hypothetical protein
MQLKNEDSISVAIVIGLLDSSHCHHGSRVVVFARGSIGKGEHLPSRFNLSKLFGGTPMVHSTVQATNMVVEWMVRNSLPIVVNCDTNG